jgi:hypothetical protein
MQRITAEDFLRAFREEWSAVLSGHHPAEIHPYRYRPRWKQFVLDDDGFLCKLMQRLDPTASLAYRKEFFGVDAAYVSRTQVASNRPASVHVLIEHEAGNHPEEEMWKLILWRVPLKVIIFYGWGEHEKLTQRRRDWGSDKIRRFHDMLHQVNEFHPEDSGTEYLFLVGAHSEEESPIEWSWATNRALDLQPLV